MQWSVENIVITIYCVLTSPIYSIVSYLSSNECAAVKIVNYITQHIRALVRFLSDKNSTVPVPYRTFVVCIWYIMFPKLFLLGVQWLYIYTRVLMCVLFVTKIEYYCLTDYNHDNEFSVSYDFARISIPCDARLPTRIHNVGYIGWWVLFLCLLSVILAGLYTSDIVWLCKLLRLCVTHYNSIPIIILLCTLTSLSYGGQSKGSYFVSE